MGKDNEKSESQFGFKDKAKAQETIELLKSHDIQYQKLTVRGLLGRAKRVLTMTKAPDKVKNIEEAIATFENWLKEHGGGASNKNSKSNLEGEKVETVSGLGFKDKAAAEKSLKIMEGRDPDYQRLAIKGLIGSSKRVLSGTKDKKKIEDITEGVKILEDFIEKYDLENRSRLNRAYLAHDVVSKFPKPNNKLCLEFVKVYSEKKNYKHLRTLYPSENQEKSWDIVRNKNVKDLEKRIKEKNKQLFDEGGEPTEEHIALIQWAYSPQPDKVKSYLEARSSKGEKRKNLDDESVSKKKNK